MIGEGLLSVYTFMDPELWLSDPEAAYAEWQRAEATGADRRTFAERSIVQHRSMFARFHRYLGSRGITLMDFGTDHIDGFFADLDRDCEPGTSTPLRYLKLMDRLSRHLSLLGLRTDNPAATLLPSEHWPDDEPMPVFLWPDEDARLQDVCRTATFESFKELRNRAIVALLLATGITAAELSALSVDDLDTAGSRVTVYVKKHGPRIARRVPVDGFALELVREYAKARAALPVSDRLLFMATAGGKPMKPATLGQCVRSGVTRCRRCGRRRKSAVVAQHIWSQTPSGRQDQRTGEQPDGLVQSQDDDPIARDYFQHRCDGRSARRE